MNTIDQAANWIGRLEVAGFEIETETDRDLVTVSAKHPTGEMLFVRLAVRDGQIDSRSTKIDHAIAHVPFGKGATIAHMQTPKSCGSSVDRAIYNSARLAGLGQPPAHSCSLLACGQSFENFRAVAA